MDYQGTLIAVKDIEKAKDFYLSVFGFLILVPIAFARCVFPTPDAP